MTTNQIFVYEKRNGEMLLHGIFTNIKAANSYLAKHKECQIVPVENYEPQFLTISK